MTRRLRAAIRRRLAGAAFALIAACCLAQSARHGEPAPPPLPDAALLRLPEPVPVTVSNLRLLPFRYYRQYITVDLPGVSATDIEVSRVTRGVDGAELVWRRLASFRDPQTGERVLPDELIVEMDDATGRNVARALGATAGGAPLRVSCLFVRTTMADHCRAYVVAVGAAPRPGGGWQRFGIRSIAGFDRLTPPEKAAAIERFFPDLWARIAPPPP